MGNDSGTDSDIVSETAYIMSIQPHASLTKIGLAAPVATCFGIVLNVIFYIVFVRKNTCRIKKK